MLKLQKNVIHMKKIMQITKIAYKSILIWMLLHVIISLFERLIKFIAKPEYFFVIKMDLIITI